MSMTIPTLPTTPAGYIMQAADMNNLAYAAQFLLTKPMTRVHDGVGGQTLTSGVLVSFSVADFDSDGMWSAGSPTRLTVQTPGFYKVDYMIDQNSGISMNAAIQITTGSNNPLGSGFTSQCWPSYGYGLSNRVCPRASGVIPFFMYALDYASIIAYPTGSCTTSFAPATFTPSYLALELVSI